jgi:hypothetical protein
MQYCVVDACFPLLQQSFGMAAMWLKYELSRRDIAEAPISSADCLLVTCVDARNVDFVARIKKKFPGKHIIAGGSAGYAPASIAQFCDCVCVGNGERFMDVLFSDGLCAAMSLPESFVHGETRTVQVASGFPWRMPPIQAEDGMFRLWCGRGCKKKCAYCQTGWSCEYEENPNPKSIVAYANRLGVSGDKFAYLSNDPLQHSFHDLLPQTESSSFSFEYIKKYGLPNARQVRLGVEGPSQRLRAFVRKPIAHDDLWKSTSWMNQNGKSVRWFMIAGLPSETDADYEELKTALTNWKKYTPKGVLALSFTAWQPEPSTPLGAFPLDDSYYDRYNRFKEWFFGIGFSNKIKIMNPMSPKARLESAIARMCLPSDKLYVGDDWGPNNRIEYPYKAQRNKMYVLLKKEAMA